MLVTEKNRMNAPGIRHELGRLVYVAKNLKSRTKDLLAGFVILTQVLIQVIVS